MDRFSLSVFNESVKKCIDDIIAKGADFTDIRYFLADEEESLFLFDGNLDGNKAEFQGGIGVRVLYKGSWGFAASSNLHDMEHCFSTAYINAEISSQMVAYPLSMGTPRNGISGEYTDHVIQCPFEVPLNEKLDFIHEIDSHFQDSWINHRYVKLVSQKKHIHYRNSEGAQIEKKLTNIFSTFMVLAMDSDSQMQRRSFSLFSDGNGSRGWEMLRDSKTYREKIVPVKDELKQLVAAPRLKYGQCDVILLPGQGFLQVHETIGHPLELDRILGYELSFAGGSFVDLESFGTLQYGSEKLSVSAYGGFENSPGSFGFDDEGSVERDYLLIDKGILKDALTSRSMIEEANKSSGKHIFDESGGVSRSTAFHRVPIDRMTNVNVLPGDDGTLEDIISNTENGIVVDNPTSWSIGPNREHFHFGCEIAWEVKHGKITNVLRNPTYQGHTLEFYRNLVAVGDQSTWRVEQVDNCGKGEPNQIMQLGHGIPVMKFAAVTVGEKDD